MASLRSEFPSSHRRPLLLVALVPGLRTTPFLPEDDQPVAFSASFLAEASLHRQTSMIDARSASTALPSWAVVTHKGGIRTTTFQIGRSEEHTSELQSLAYLVCRLLLEKK